jgi:F-type H+-transporting ATPase subunit b
VHINWWTLALQAVNVLVLVWLLSRFLYRPVVAAIATRQASAEALLADAAASKAQAETEAAALKASNAALATDSERLRAQVRTAAEADGARLLEAARAEAAKVRAEAEVGIAAERDAMRKALETQAANLAADMAAKVLAALPAVTVQQAMLAALTARLAAMPEPERARTFGGALTLVTPADLNEADRTQCRAALAKLLPQPLDLAFDEEPALIGGCDLRGEHVHLRNSWRADLDAMLGHLAKDGNDDRHA